MRTLMPGCHSKGCTTYSSDGTVQSLQDQGEALEPRGVNCRPLPPGAPLSEFLSSLETNPDSSHVSVPQSHGRLVGNASLQGRHQQQGAFLTASFAQTNLTTGYLMQSFQRLGHTLGQHLGKAWP